MECVPISLNVLYPVLFDYTNNAHIVFFSIYELVVKYNLTKANTATGMDTTNDILSFVVFLIISCFCNVISISVTKALYNIILLILSLIIYVLPLK